MHEKTIVKLDAPVTQSIDSVKALLSWRGHLANPLPTDVSLENGRLVLVLSNKKHAYYTVTAKECSCPARNWHSTQRCKHMRRYFPQSETIQKQTMADTLEQADKNLSKMPYQYQRMVKAAREAAESEPLELDPERKPFRPFLEDKEKQAKAAEVA